MTEPSALTNPMNELMHTTLTRVITLFVEGLEGRYNEHVSDKFLIAILMRQCAPFRTQIFDGDVNAAYTASCPIFENILEYQCGAGGNGHHVAQSFQKHFNEAFCKYQCTHLDHNDSETCEDRAIGCSMYCRCCLGENARPYFP